jgi:uncharacterized coiled-coil protein SlyX
MSTEVRSDAGERGSALDAELLRRVAETFAAVRTGRGRDAEGGYGPQLDERLRVVADRAAFYYKWPTIPNWPPHLFFRKVMRKLLKPVLWPIVEFHFAVRDALSELRERVEGQAGAHREALATVTELERQVEELQDQVRILTGQVAALAAGETSHISSVAYRNGAAAPVAANGANGANGAAQVSVAAVGGGHQAS